MTLNERAWKIAQQMWDMVSHIDNARLSQGVAENIAESLQTLATQLKPAFRQANMVINVELVEAALKDLRKPRSDKSNALTRLQDAVYGVHMRAHSLAHPSGNLNP